MRTAQWPEQLCVHARKDLCNIHARSVHNIMRPLALACPSAHTEHIRSCCCVWGGGGGRGGRRPLKEILEGRAPQCHRPCECR